MLLSLFSSAQHLFTHKPHFWNLVRYKRGQKEQVREKNKRERERRDSKQVISFRVDTQSKNKQTQHDEEEASVFFFHYVLVVAFWAGIGLTTLVQENRVFRSLSFHFRSTEEEASSLSSDTVPIASSSISNAKKRAVEEIESCTTATGPS